MPHPNSTSFSDPQGSAADPAEAPDFCERYVEQFIKSIQPDNPVFIRRRDLLEWSSAAGFEQIDLHHLGDDCWEIHCRRGTNAECTNAAEAERWLGYVARGCNCRIESGLIVAVVQGDRITARMKLRPREPLVQPVI